MRLISFWHTLSTLLSHCHYNNKRNAQQCAKHACLGSQSLELLCLTFCFHVMFPCFHGNHFTTMFLHELDPPGFVLLVKCYSEQSHCRSRYPNRLTEPCLVLFTCTFMSSVVLCKIKEPQHMGSYNKQVYYLKTFYLLSTAILVYLRFTLELLWAQIKFDFVL